LNYDKKNENGIIFNDRYPKGAMYTGKEFKPVLSFEYDSFIYSERGHTQYDLLLNGRIRNLTDKEKAEVRQVAIDWVQPLGQIGNPTKEQIFANKIHVGHTMLSRTSICFDPDMYKKITDDEIEELVTFREVMYNLINDPENTDIPCKDNLSEPLTSVMSKFGIRYNPQTTPTMCGV
jgi:hypothetical protein